MLRAITRTIVTRSVLVALAATGAAGAAVAAQEETAGVEIITGDGRRVETPAGTAGVRVMSFIQSAGDSPSFRVVDPIRSIEMLAVQRALATAGFDPGVFDGLMGPATRSALRGFQNAAGTTPCGCVDYETIVGLGLRPLVVQTVIGSAADEPEVEIVVPLRAIEPQTPPSAPPPDTVFVSIAGPAEGSLVYPVFPVGVPVIIGPGPKAPSPAPPAGVPFGGPIRLGPPSVRPPPRR